MSLNEGISRFNPDVDLPDTKFDEHLADVSVVNNRLIVEGSKGTSSDVGQFRIASAVYCVGAYIDPQGKAVMVLSDGQEIVLNKVTSNNTYQVTLSGQGYFTGNNKSELQFEPVLTNFPMTFDGSNFSLAQANNLRLNRYVRIENRGPWPAGRIFTSWTPIDIRTITNNLGWVFNGNSFTIPAGRYYVSITGQQYRGVTGSFAIIDAGTNLPISELATSLSHSSANSTFMHTRQELVIAEPTIAYFGAIASAPQHTANYGLGVTGNLDTTYASDLFNYLEFWRVDE